MILENVPQKVMLLLLVGLLMGCAAQSPDIGEIQAQKTTITTGGVASLTIPASGKDLKFEWVAQKGTLSNSTQPAVIYTAPDSPGPDIVTVKITYSGGQVIRHITFDVVAHPTPATETPLPADTPTSTVPSTLTVAPEPIACNHPSVTKNLFPQLQDVNGQFPIYGPEGDSHILCQAVYDIVHNGQIAVHFKYENVGKNFGWWGIATPNGYDTSQYSQLCFWAYAQVPNQSFRLKMKDTTRKENGVIVTIQVTNQWNQICTDISEFSARGIQVDKMDNVNLGFEQPTGSSDIWVADFEFN